MNTHEVTYAFRDGHAFAIHQGKVIASGPNLDEVERQVKRAWMDSGEDYDPAESGGYLADPHGRPGQPEWDDPNGPYYDPPCKACGARQGAVDPKDPEGVCAACGHHNTPQGNHDADSMYGGDHGPPDSDYGDSEMNFPRQGQVITPNGLKGTVLGKVASTWGEEVTVRLENGRIVHLPTNTKLTSVQTKQASKAVDPISRLESRLARTVDGTRDSLIARHQELDLVRGHASNLIREGANHAESLRLDQLVVTAEVEQREIIDAIAHLDASEPVAPPSFTISAAKEAAGISREDASWLDHTLDQMVKEAEAQDFGKLMDEGPEVLVAELNDAALADTGVTRQMASNFIGAKTAGIDRQVVEPYMATFLARVEECRRAELANRTTHTKKEAAVEEDKFKDLPDEAFFM